MIDMTFWIKLAFLFVRRSWRSTIILGTMVAFAIAALIFLAALAVGTNDTMVRNSVGLFSGHIAGHNLPAEVSAEKLRIKGVKGVLTRKGLHLWFGHGNRVEGVDLWGVEPAAETRLTAIARKITAGGYPHSSQRAVLLSKGVADRLDVRPGDVISYGVRPGTASGEFPVAGIYQTGVAHLDQGMAFCPMGALPGGDVSVSAAVFLNDGVDPADILARYASLFGGTAQFKAWTDFMPDLKQLIDLNYVSMGIVMVLVFAIVALSISSAFVIFILKHLRQYGIIKSMGVTPAESTLLIGNQIILITLAASVVGVAVGALVSAIFGQFGIDLAAFTSHNQYFTVSGVIYPRLTLFSLCLPPAMALVFGLLSAVWPSIFVMRKKAAEILRSS